MSRSSLATRLGSEDALVAVIGLGYVGRPVAAALLDGGYRVLGFDVNADQVRAVEQSDLGRARAFEATGDPERLAAADALLICVPTPLGPNRDPDLSHVRAAAATVGQHLRAGQLVILESTSYPGTTRDVLLPELLAARPPAAMGLECGRDFFVAYSPEREDPGRASHTTRTIPRLVGGLDDASRDLAVQLYERAVETVIPVSTPEVAEASKLLENVFRAVNIALVNEMKMTLTELGIDIGEVVRAAATKPFGFMPFEPGPGLGGHCIPIDPFYFAWKAREVGRSVRFVELAGEVNTEMPGYVVERLVGALNARRQAVNGARILILGLAYKPGVGDTRESPSLELLRRLEERGAKVDYADPHVPVEPGPGGRRSTVLTAETVRRYDALLLATAHPEFDYEMIASEAQLVVDTRDALRAFAGQMGARRVQA